MNIKYQLDFFDFLSYETTVYWWVNNDGKKVFGVGGFYNNNTDNYVEDKRIIEVLIKAINDLLILDKNIGSKTAIYVYPDSNQQALIDYFELKHIQTLTDQS